MKMKKVLAAVLATTTVLASVATASAATTVQSEGSSAATYEEQYTLTANASVSVAGSSVKTTLSGVYAAESVQGVAITSDLSTINTTLQL